jgi:hypothetical protein
MHMPPPDVDYDNIREFWYLYDEALDRFLGVMREFIYLNIMGWMEGRNVIIPSGRMCEVLRTISKHQGRSWCARVATHAIIVVCNAMRVQIDTTINLLRLVPYQITNFNHAVQARWINETVLQTMHTLREFMIRDLLDHNFVLATCVHPKEMRYLSWLEVCERRLAWLLLTKPRLSKGSAWSGLDDDIILYIGRLQLF